MIIPSTLTKGDTVSVAATAKKVDKELLAKGLSIIKNWGLSVETGAHVLDGDFFLAGRDEDRANDFNELLHNPNVKAIFCARGGYGTGRILDKLELNVLHDSPKWILGFSDLTLLHLRLSSIGIASIHGPMPAIFHKTDPEALEQLRKFLFEGSMEPLIANTNDANRIGTFEGEIVGGNLAMICSSIGTKDEINTDGKILLLEDVDEPLYRIDRMMYQLQKTGKLSNLGGLVVGHFSMPPDQEAFDFSLEEIILSKLNEYNYPVAFGFQVGHEPGNFPVPMGAPFSFHVSPEGSKLELINEK